MRILQLTNMLVPAGAERVVLELSRGLAREGHKVAVISLLPLPASSFVVDRLRDAGIPVSSIGLTKRTPWRALRLRGAIDRFRPDLVNAHLYHSYMLGRLTGFRRRYRLVDTIHSSERRPGLGWRMIPDRMTLGLTDSIAAVSEASRRFHANALGVPTDRIHVIANGIIPPVPLSPGEVAALRAAWGVENCSLVLGSAGRLVYQKGYDLLLDLVPELASRIPPGERWGLVVLGDGPEAENLRGRAGQAPPALTIRFPGFRADADRCLGAFDLFVMPSRCEGFGLVLSEAMAHGVPAVVSTADSLPDLVHQYPGGSVVDFAGGDTAIIVNALVDKLQNPSPRKPWVPHTVDRMVQEYLELYRRLCPGD